MKCYVCGNEIKGTPRYIGNGLYYHKHKCCPGSKAWFLSKATPRNYWFWLLLRHSPYQGEIKKTLKIRRIK